MEYNYKIILGVARILHILYFCDGASLHCELPRRLTREDCSVQPQQLKAVSKNKSSERSGCSSVVELLAGAGV